MTQTSKLRAALAGVGRYFLGAPRDHNHKTVRRPAKYPFASTRQNNRYARQLAAGQIGRNSK